MGSVQKREAEQLAGESQGALFHRNSQIQVSPCDKMVATGLYLLGHISIVFANPLPLGIVLVCAASSTAGWWSEGDPGCRVQMGAAVE